MTLFFKAMMALCFLSQLCSAEEPSKPNIIYILADDLGYGELGCYGQSKIQTPHLDKLAVDGIRFTQHYAGTSVCAPTRCSLMTGLHTGHCYIRANSPGYPNAQTPIPKNTETIGRMLKRTGYRTACIGKWGLGNFNNSGCANDQGFDYFYGYYDQRHAHEYYTDHLYRNKKRVELDGKTYSHDLLTSEALTFIEQNQDRPFFLYLPYCIPHTKFQVPELGAYDAKNWKPEHKTHAAMISRMDRDVGRLMKKLQKLGIENRTLVMFSSDHGAHGQSGTAEFFQSSGPLRDVKRSMYEGGLRVPLIARWPGKIEAGRVSEHVSAFWDMLPTFAELGVAHIEKSVDGISLVNELLATGPNAEHEYLYWELFELPIHNRAIRVGKWKGVIPNFYKSQELELYDLEADLGEQNNLASQFPEIAAKLKDKMSKVRTRSELWNVESRGFNIEAACKATSIAMPK